MEDSHCKTKFDWLFGTENSSSVGTIKVKTLKPNFHATESMQATIWLFTT